MELFSGSKLIHHLPRVEEWRVTGASRPILLEIDMTNACDHKCPLCTYGFARNSDKLSLGEAKSLLQQSVDLGVLAVLFTGGGEPLLNNDTLPSLQIAANSGLEVGLITHGGHIDENDAKTIVQNATWCRVSLDAANPGMYKIIHGVNERSWENTLRGISLLVKQKRKLNSLATIGIGYLVDERTLVDIQEIAHLSIDLRVDYIQFRPFRETKLDVREHINELRRVFPNSPTKFICSEARYDAIGAPRSYMICRATNFDLAVGADFKVYACCDTKYQADACLGDLRKNSLEEIWNGKVRKKKNGKIYSFCPQPCRHHSNNELLNHIESDTPHKNFV